MESIKFELEDENASDNEELAFSDNEGENFIDNSYQEDNQSPSFYRFMNQTRDTAEAVNDHDGSHLDRHDLKPEMFYCIRENNREHVKLNLKDLFFNAILYSLLFHLMKDNKVCKDKTEEILSKEFYDKFKKKIEMLQLDHSLENFFKKCHVANDFLKIYFLGSGKGEINFDTQ